MSRLDSYTRYPRPLLWLVRGGETTIGGPSHDARPAFRATLPSFYISKFPVTNVQFEAFDPEFERSPVSRGDDDPAGGVRLPDAVAYCEWYAEIARKPIRLPAEVEWEHACRAGSVTRCFFGDAPPAAEEFVWDASNSNDRLPPLRLKKPNAFGLCGMLGGVWEWTSSRFVPYPHPDDGRDDPKLPGRRVLRGGSFRTPRESLGSGVRRACDPEARHDDVGFRILREFDSG